MKQWREEGRSLDEIATMLNADGFRPAGSEAFLQGNRLAADRPLSGQAVRRSQPLGLRRLQLRETP